LKDLYSYRVIYIHKSLAGTDVIASLNFLIRTFVVVGVGVAKLTSRWNKLALRRDLRNLLSELASFYNVRYNSVHRDRQIDGYRLG